MEFFILIELCVFCFYFTPTPKCNRHCTESYRKVKVIYITVIFHIGAIDEGERALKPYTLIMIL